jgi:hypothetical protein
MTRYEAPKDLSFVLETADGRISIEGRDHASTFLKRIGELNEAYGMTFMGGAGRLAFHQGIVRYSWDDEVAYGMIERSYLLAQMVG